MEGIAPDGHTSQTFSLFSLLPTELRLQIWRHSLQPRVVELRYSKAKDTCTTPTPPPVILQVSREARDEAQFIYRRPFATAARPDSTIYFAPDHDTLYIPRGDGAMGYDDAARDFASHVPAAAAHIRRLAIDHVQPDIRRPWETYNKFCLLRSFPRLDQAFLVLAPEEGDGGDTSDAVGGNINVDASSGKKHPLTAESDFGVVASGRRQIELVDPHGDPLRVLGIMANVRESFSYEVGSICFSGEQGVNWVGGEVALSLIPKYKTAGNPAREWNQDRTSTAVVCA